MGRLFGGWLLRGTSSDEREDILKERQQIADLNGVKTLK